MPSPTRRRSLGDLLAGGETGSEDEARARRGQGGRARRVHKATATARGRRGDVDLRRLADARRNRGTSAQARSWMRKAGGGPARRESRRLDAVVTALRTRWGARHRLARDAAVEAVSSPSIYTSTSRGSARVPGVAARGAQPRQRWSCRESIRRAAHREGETALARLDSTARGAAWRQHGEHLRRRGSAGRLRKARQLVDAPVIGAGELHDATARPLANASSAAWPPHVPPQGRLGGRGARRATRGPGARSGLGWAGFWLGCGFGSAFGSVRWARAPVPARPGRRRRGREPASARSARGRRLPHVAQVVDARSSSPPCQAGGRAGSLRRCGRAGRERRAQNAAGALGCAARASPARPARPLQLGQERGGLRCGRALPRRGGRDRRTLDHGAP